MMESLEKALKSTGFIPLEPSELPEWIETPPVRTAINRITGERIFLDPNTKTWRYLPARAD
jgi:hypothetical protein